MLFFPQPFSTGATLKFIVLSILSSYLISYLYRLSLVEYGPNDWFIGISKVDMTGPIGQINMMGYAVPEQFANGLHLRLKARTFIIANPARPSIRIVYISTDTGMVSYRCKQKALDIVREQIQSNLYTDENVMISATHTHSGPGGYPDEFLYHITSLGIVESVKDAISKALAESILKAHTMVEDRVRLQQYSFLRVHTTKVENASINRSPTSYLANPEYERKQYDFNVDNQMILLSFFDTSSDQEILVGNINWFAVHGTSMKNNNLYVSGDNKGYASYLWETKEELQGNAKFVAAFSQSNSGDVSPNIEGSTCVHTNEPCDGSSRSCNGDITKCIARGPGSGDFESTKIIGTRQVEAARNALLTSPRIKHIPNKVEDRSLMGFDYSFGYRVSRGGAQFRHAWINMSDIQLSHSNGKVVQTCLPAMGYAFAAGTTDGPGSSLAFQEVNATAATSILLNLLRDVLKSPSQAQKECHYPKQIFISTGEIEYPYLWQPSVVPIQAFLIGAKFVILGVPAEITTMAGRRLRENIYQILLRDKAIDPDALVVIAGLSNSYSSYITTYEEYQVQRYEGGSTIFGPHTLQAYIDQFSRLLSSSMHPRTVDPPKAIANQLQLLPAVYLDTPPLFKWFGDVKEEPSEEVRIGDRVQCIFYCAHPRNQIVGKSFLSIEGYISGGKWIQILTDDSWDTKFLWERKGASESQCTLEWSIGETVPVAPGLYRFRYFGRHKILHCKTILLIRRYWRSQWNKQIF